MELSLSLLDKKKCMRQNLKMILLTKHTFLFADNSCDLVLKESTFCSD